MLRLPLDHHAGGELYDRLSASDAFDVERVRDIDSVGPKVDDTEICRYAVETERVVLTNDRYCTDGTADSGDGTHPGVIRYVEYDWVSVSEAIENIEAVMDTEDSAGHSTELFVPTGHVQEHIEEYLDSLDDERYYTCGVPEMVVETKDRLDELGVSDDRVVSEGREDGAVED